MTLVRKQPVLVHSKRTNISVQRNLTMAIDGDGSSSRADCPAVGSGTTLVGALGAVADQCRVSTGGLTGHQLKRSRENGTAMRAMCGQCL